MGEEDAGGVSVCVLVKEWAGNGMLCMSGGMGIMNKVGLKRE